MVGCGRIWLGYDCSICFLIECIVRRAREARMSGLEIAFAIAFVL
jgi:hypothetical protein